MNTKTALFRSFSLFLGLAVAPTYGQVLGVKVKVPFQFVVANKTLPEGEYMLSSVRDEVFVQDSRGRRVAMVQTNAVSERHTIGETGEVLFECYSDLCFLSQLWTPGQHTGRELPMSRAERERAKRESGKYFALLATPSSK